MHRKLVLKSGVKSVENTQRMVAFRVLTPYKNISLLLQPSESLPNARFYEAEVRIM